MRVVIFTLIGIIVFLGAVSFINKNDKENRIDVNKKGIIALIITLSTTLIYIKYKANVEFYVYFYLSIYLIIVGYIDYKTKNVYSIFNWLTIMIGIWFLIYQKSIGIDISFTIVCVIIYIIFAKLIGYFNMFGDGDTDIFIATSIFVSSISLNTFPLVILLLNMILSNLVLIMFNIKLLDVRKMKFKEQIAFAPSIALSTFILILLL
ncbi:hypothetical protein [uncultured Clostridium sp.]|jgi:leader peptidase (prepilin peptidase)/N-methyltransferase|uniref:hypothetical protein n=1 Tax=uncultured Clostridium sp. TaxID=59620 RepID=UPI002671A6DE|nr:hypothetical protein [uncultured Clostridium sp.]